MLQALYLLHFRPFESPTMQRVEVFNEICSLCLMYALMCFSGANASAAGEESSDASATRVEFDLAFLAILGINLLVHLSLLMKSSIVDLKEKVKAKCKCCRK